jgi:Asp-tRNA(Asn)/Glu-tRNA(Gln) amidotransferase A subunit family amidase
LSELVRTRQVSSVDLTRMYLSRLTRHNAALNCVASLTEERALREAAAADTEIDAGKYRGPLHGVPYGVKDIIAARGYPTRWGAAPLERQEFDADATVVERLHEAGAVLVAKLTTGELAFGDQWSGGRTNNPWNLSEGSSGSSAGSGAATAAGLVGFAIGSDTGGSILSPAVRCGVVGLRPTFGRVSRHGVMSVGAPRTARRCLARSPAPTGTTSRFPSRCRLRGMPPGLGGRPGSATFRRCSRRKGIRTPAPTTPAPSTC